MRGARLPVPVRIACAIAILVVTSACAATYPSQIDSILGTDSLNQLSADSAPQQSVVNGWTARDLLELAARQQTEANLLLYGLAVLMAVVVLQLVVLNRRIARIGRPEPLGGPGSDPPATGTLNPNWVASDPTRQGDYAPRDTPD